MIVPLGDGRQLEVASGPLRKPPEPVVVKKPKVSRVKKRKVVRSKAVTLRGFTYKSDPRKSIPKGQPPEVFNAGLTTPGLREWMALRAGQLASVNTATGRQMGHADGMTPKQAEAVWAQSRKRAKRDMEDIKKKIVLTEAAEEALESALGVMRSPLNNTTKLAAAKLVLDFTMAKPVAKSEVTVNAAEQWLESLKNGE